MKKSALILALVLLVSLLAGCAGTPVVYYSDCTCPADSHGSPVADNTVTEPAQTTEGAVKTGLAIVGKLDGSKNADAEGNGKADYNVTIVAVTVTDEGVIDSCVIDSIGTSVAFDAAGIPVDFTPVDDVPTKNELGDAYGMKAIAKSKYEWYEQAAALADYAEGKTVDELKNGAVNESGKAADADLASVATISIGDYVDAIVAAAANAQHLGARAGDELRLATVNSLDASAGQESGGAAELTVNAAALTLKGEIITSCTIDALQAKVDFDGNGTITTDVTAIPQTKNQLGEAYGMKLYAGAAYEWNEQAAFFAEYVTGKTAGEVAGIAVNESGKAAEVDLAATVTIAIGDFLKLIAKAAA